MWNLCSPVVLRRRGHKRIPLPSGLLVCPHHQYACRFFRRSTLHGHLPDVHRCTVAFPGGNFRHIPCAQPSKREEFSGIKTEGLPMQSLLLSSVMTSSSSSCVSYRKTERQPPDNASEQSVFPPSGEWASRESCGFQPDLHHRYP